MTEPVWIITPHKLTAYDSCVIPVKGDEEGRKALDYAKSVLETLWDEADSLDTLDIKVSIRRGNIDISEIDDGK